MLHAPFMCLEYPHPSTFTLHHTRCFTTGSTLEHYELRNELRYEKDIRNALRAS